MVKYILEPGKDFDKSNYQQRLKDLEGRVFDDFIQVDNALERVVPKSKVYRAGYIIYTATELPVTINTWPIYEEQKNGEIEVSRNKRSVIRYEVARIRVVAY